MKYDSYYYNCSPEYIPKIGSDLQQEVIKAIPLLQRRQKQSKINLDLCWIVFFRNSIQNSFGLAFSRK